MLVAQATSDADRMEVMRVAYAAFGASQAFGIYAAIRLFSPLRRRATWWLARENGVAVASLLAHPLAFARGSERQRAFGLGSVAVLPSHQRRGLASRLCGEVAGHEGAPGLLFSAVPTRVYEQMGYRPLPAYDHRCRDLGALIASGPAAELRPIDPVREQATLARAWAEGQAGWRLARGAEGWRNSFIINAEDLWFACDGGYVRLVADTDTLEVVELFATDRAAVLRACGELAHAWGKPHLDGWFEPGPFVAEHFIDRGRATTRPMAMGLPDAESAWFSSADYF